MLQRDVLKCYLVKHHIEFMSEIEAYIRLKEQQQNALEVNEGTESSGKIDIFSNYTASLPPGIGIRKMQDIGEIKKRDRKTHGR